MPHSQHPRIPEVVHEDEMDETTPSTPTSSFGGFCLLTRLASSVVALPWDWTDHVRSLVEEDSCEERMAFDRRMTQFNERSCSPPRRRRRGEEVSILPDFFYRFGISKRVVLSDGTIRRLPSSHDTLFMLAWVPAVVVMLFMLACKLALRTEEVQGSRMTQRF